MPGRGALTDHRCGLTLRARAKLTAVRRRLRFHLWVLRTRRSLARHGCSLEIVAPYGLAFDTAPVIELTRRHLGDTGTERGGSLRLELAHDVDLGRATIIEVLPGSSSVLRLDAGVRCFSGVRFALLGGAIHIGAGTSLRDGVMLKSSGRLTIGAFGIVNNVTVVHCAGAIELGEHPQVAERVTIIDSDHLADGSDVYTQLQPLAVTPVVIGRNVWLGANAVILRGAVLGANSVVAANSTVRAGEYPAGWLVAGAPAVARRPLGPAADPAP